MILPPPTPGWQSGTGVPHPTGGYDEVVVDQANFTTSYFADELLHRLDGPASTILYPDGGKNSEEWYRRGVLHREDGPAYLGWHSNGQLAEATYLRNGQSHREDGPSDTQYRRTGIPWIENYRIEGKLHRLDGPAVTSWSDLGNVSATAFYVDDVEVSEEALGRVREALDSGAPLEWAIAYALGGENP